MTKPMANTVRSPSRPTRRHRRGVTGKSTTGKQAGGDARHTIIAAARSSHDPEGGGLIEARKQGGTRRRGQGDVE